MRKNTVDNLIEYLIRQNDEESVFANPFESGDTLTMKVHVISAFDNEYCEVEFPCLNKTLQTCTSIVPVSLLRKD